MWVHQKVRCQRNFVHKRNAFELNVFHKWQSSKIHTKLSLSFNALKALLEFTDFALKLLCIIIVPALYINAVIFHGLRCDARINFESGNGKYMFGYYMQIWHYLNRHIQNYCWKWKFCHKWFQVLIKIVGVTSFNTKDL